MASETNPKRKADWSSFTGLLLGAGGILGGLVLEGGKLQEVMQGTAAIIVFGGTLGATLVTTPFRVVRNALARVPDIFFESVHSPEQAIGEIVEYAAKARKSGLISLEADAERIADPFLRKAMGLAVDGTNVKDLRQMMELEMQLEGRHYEEAARVFTSAGGYAPTIGIIGAVLGLMQVMKNLANIAEVGHGIATAFVATVYGVASANIFFLPAGGKILARFQAARQMRELALLGVVAIVEGMNPKLIRAKLEAFSAHWSCPQPPTASPSPAGPEQSAMAATAD